MTRYDPIPIWEIDMGDRYGRSDINEISIGISIWDMGYRHGIWYIDMVIYHIDMVILDIDMGYGLMIWEMIVSIRSSSVSIWDILSLWTRSCGSYDNLPESVLEVSSWDKCQWCRG